MTRQQSVVTTRVTFYTAITLPLIISLYYVLFISTDWDRISSFQESMANIAHFFPPNVVSIPSLIGPTIDTLLIALFSTLFIGIIAPPVAWMSARNMSPNIITYMFGRAIIIITRSVHELIWALFFVIAVGLGPLAGILAIGVHGIGFVSKMTAEEIEAIDVGPIEALRATGASRLKVVILSVIPQVIPTYLGTLIFQCEIGIRSAAIIGVVGAGGLGLALNQAIILFKWKDVMAVVIVLAAIVIAGEFLSRFLRKRII